MSKLNEIKQFFINYKPIIQEKYQITELGIFGSYVRGEQTEASDLDVLIDYSNAPSLLDIVDLEFYLSECLGVKVDVVTKKGLKPRVKENILAEVIYV
ncbi:MAG: nucleotidyltransferase family protein [Symploca sp. SIO1A3]|nr:nucleotidyltransferase family protein [Symploca sp. SIO1A3]